MDFSEIFTAYYTLYRGEAQTPDSTDDEYTIAMRLANEAVNRWANYDGMYWNELFDTNQHDGTGAQTIATGQLDYAAPTNMKEAGGLIKITSADGTAQNYIPIIQPNEAQFRGDMSKYAYFTGNPSSGFTLRLNPAPTSEANGHLIDYVYYKKPTLFTTGTDVTEMSNPYFIVHEALANRFRVSRNPYYTSALRDAQDALKVMKLDNDSGTWANPIKVADNSGTNWGN